MADAKPLEAIEIIREGLVIGSRALKPGDIVQAAEIGEGLAQMLIDNKRAKRAAQKAEG
jgi:hypothetical protein